MEVRSVQQFLDYWDGLRGRTRRVVACIPPDRLEWTYRAGSFTLGDQVRHLATIERYMYAETVAGRPSRYPAAAASWPMATTRCMAYFERLDVEAKAIIGGLSDTDLERKCQTPAGRSHHDLEVAPSYGGARGPSPRADLPHAQHAGGAHAAALRPDLRRGPGQVGVTRPR